MRARAETGNGKGRSTGAVRTSHAAMTGQIGRPKEMWTAAEEKNEVLDPGVVYILRHNNNRLISKNSTLSSKIQ